jgi:hypothetical protein
MSATSGSGLSSRGLPSITGGTGIYEGVTGQLVNVITGPGVCRPDGLSHPANHN